MNAITATSAHERVLPHNLEAERSVLGAIILRNEAINEAVEVIDGDDFYRDAHHRIFDKMIALSQRNVPIDLITLKEELNRAGELDEIGGPAYIARLVDGVPRTTDVKFYAGIVKEKSVLRTAITRAEDVTAAAYRGDIEKAAAAIEVMAAVRFGVDGGAYGDEAPSPLVDDASLMTLPDPAFQIDRFLVGDTIPVLYGAPGTGKTFLALDWGLSVASGRPWLGQGVLPGRVVYVAAEGAAGLKRRVAAWKVSRDLPLTDTLGLYVWPEAVDLIDGKAFERFRASVDPVSPALIVLDTVSRCFVGDENGQADMAAFVAAVDRLRRELGATVLLIHHSNKAGTGERGSSVLRGAADSVFALTAVDDVITLTTEKQKDSAPADPVALRLAPYGGSLVVRAATDITDDASLTPVQNKVAGILRLAFAGGATRAELVSALPSVSQASIYRAIDELCRKGFVVPRGQGRGMRFVASVMTLGDA